MAQPLDRAPAPRVVGVPVHGRVLLAEDNPVNQQVAAAMIQRLGLRVDVAGNGKEVLEQMALLPYDLVFMDCEMPEMDGYAATAEIRRRTTGAPRVPIVAMTAHAMEGDRERCLAAGMDDYVTKPVNPAVIEAVIRRWIRTSEDRNGGEPIVEAAVVLDPQRITQLRSALGSGDGSLFRRVVEAFLGDTRARLAALRQALDREDPAAVRRQRIQSSCYAWPTDPHAFVDDVESGRRQAHLEVSSLTIAGDTATARIDEGSTRETWRFVRVGGRWRVDEIRK